MKGKILNVEVYGSSHSEAIGVKIEGLPKGIAFDEGRIKNLLDRRRAIDAPWSTPRKEPDIYEFIEGVSCGVAHDGTACDCVTGTVVAEIRNTDKRSGDYGAFKHIPRPSHADYAAMLKDGINEVAPGGGRFSGRLTAPLCIAGGIAESILSEYGIEVCAYVAAIGNVCGKSYKHANITKEEIRDAQRDALPALARREDMLEEILDAASTGDSVGGTIECIVFGLKGGVGDSSSDGMESAIAASVYGVPAVKGVEFGEGFGLARMRGSVANDPFRYKDGRVITTTNHSGGINGGITNGMPVTLSVAMRPTPSIAIRQESVDVVSGENVYLEIKGRHDACIVPRAVAAIESAVALAVLDKVLADY